MIFGAMQIASASDAQGIEKADVKRTHMLLEHCLSVGINVIDLADIYGLGKAEALIGKVFKQNPKLRERFVVQSKVGIRLTPSVDIKHYDLSPGYVTRSLYASLERLNIDYLDILFLHRPDPLMEVKPLCEALHNLHQQDTFDFLAVSNMHAGQMALIQSNTDIPVIANQLQMSLAHHGFIEDAITTNMPANSQHGFPRGTLEYCMQQDIQLQAWGAMAQGQFCDLEARDPNIRATAALINTIAEELDCHANAIVLAWLMKHPAGIAPVIGTTQCERITQASQAMYVNLSNQQWYEILQTRRGQEVP
jgi:predicted oxidoreductase